MEIKKITKENGAFQVLEAIKQNRKKRSEHKKFLAEGVKPINVLVKNKWDIVDIMYSQGTELSTWAREIMQKNLNANIYEVAPDLYARLTEKDNPTEIIVSAKTRTFSLPTHNVSDEDVFLVLDRIKSPGNLGSIIRSANATGVRGVAIMGHSTDVLDVQSVRASLGACFEMPFEYFNSRDDLVQWIEKVKETTPIEIVATSAKADMSVYNFKQTKATVIMIGSESKGLSQFLSEMADVNLSLPMKGSVTSLNVASAATVVLYQVMKR